MAIGDWQGRRDEIDEKVDDVLGIDVRGHFPSTFNIPIPYYEDDEDEDYEDDEDEDYEDDDDDPDKLSAVPFDIPSRRAPIEQPRWKKFHAIAVEEAVKCIVPYLEDPSEKSQIIYFNGWIGVGASVVLASLAEDPPPSLINKFDKIIHIDCFRWKNRRELQRKIAQKLGLPQDVTNILDKHDEEDDFCGADEGSRIEIEEVSVKIHQALQGKNCLVVFNNGSNNIVDLNDFGIPQPADRWSNFIRKVLWTFRGRLRVIPVTKPTADQEHDRSSAEPTKPATQPPREQELSRDNVPETERVDNSRIYVYSYLDDNESKAWNRLVHEVAAGIAKYTHKLGVTTDVVALCCKYMLLLNSKGANVLDYNWDTHASNYWVCDGIIQGQQQDKVWEVATTLLEEMEPEDLSSYKLPNFADDKTRWVVAMNSGTAEEIKPETTSFFCTNKKGQVASLPNEIFQKSEQLHVLKLCRCTFSFSSPPFLHCQNIRFLGLDNCKDQQKELEESREGKEEQDRQKIEFFQSLWVLDISDTDWELNLSPDIIERMLSNIREINIKRGRIWSNNYAWTWIWRHLQNIHKLRVIEPTCHWKDEIKDEENKDEFTNLLKLELLDLSGNSSIQVLPSLSGTTNLSTLVLDGCIGLTTIAPEALTPSLETFSFGAEGGKGNKKEAKISRISMAGCARLVNFRLHGLLPKLEELDLSNTSVKTLDLKDEVVQVPNLQRVILLGCEQLRAILWPKGGLPKLMLLCIDTAGGIEEGARTKTPRDDYRLVNKEPEGYCHSRVAVRDMRLLQSLLLESGDNFCWNTARFNLKLHLSSASKGRGQHRAEKMGPYNIQQLAASPLHESRIPKSHHTYISDVNFDKATGDHDGSNAEQFEALDFHLEIGEEISSANVVSEQGVRAVRYLINGAESLHVHDNSTIDTVIPGGMVTRDSWSSLRRCSIERCPNMNSVFTTDSVFCFPELEAFRAAQLLMARCIWSKGWAPTSDFGKLRGIDLYLCPRLKFVLPLSWSQTLSSLETLHIINCSDLDQIFPVEAEFLEESSSSHSRGELQLPKLKHIFLHDLPKLHKICQIKMFAPSLETIWVRGCWSLKRLPATTSRPVVDCETDWWKKLEWDGKEALHHPSLFEQRHSIYYKKTLLRNSVLR